MNDLGCDHIALGLGALLGLLLFHSLHYNFAKNDGFMLVMLLVLIIGALLLLLIVGLLTWRK